MMLPRRGKRIRPFRHGRCGKAAGSATAGSSAMPASPAEGRPVAEPSATIRP
jgi:hypothetical protein